MRTRNQICADFSDPATADYHVCMKEWSSAFRRDQSDIFDYRAVIDTALCGRCRRASL
jgi:hypothetical protein